MRSLFFIFLMSLTVSHSAVAIERCGKSWPEATARTIILNPCFGQKHLAYNSVEAFYYNDAGFFKAERRFKDKNDPTRKPNHYLMEGNDPKSFTKTPIGNFRSFEDFVVKTNACCYVP
jgi:hypothetical protein